MKRPWLAAAMLAVLLVAAPAAGAHGGNADFRSVIDRVTPEVEGVEVSVRNYDAEFEVVVRDGNRVLLYGYEDEPYVRILADGTVQVNQRSPAAYLNEDRYGSTKAPAIADPEAPPHGTLFWVGPEDTSKLPFAIAGIAIVVLGGIAVLAVRRRRRRDGGAGEASAGKEAW